MHRSACTFEDPSAEVPMPLARIVTDSPEQVSELTSSLRAMGYDVECVSLQMPATGLQPADLEITIESCLRADAPAHAEQIARQIGADVFVAAGALSERAALPEPLPTPEHATEPVIKHVMDPPRIAPPKPKLVPAGITDPLAPTVLPQPMAPPEPVQQRTLRRVQPTVIWQPGPSPFPFFLEEPAENGSWQPSPPVLISICCRAAHNAVAILRSGLRGSRWSVKRISGLGGRLVGGYKRLSAALGSGAHALHSRGNRWVVALQQRRTRAAQVHSQPLSTSSNTTAAQVVMARPVPAVQEAPRVIPAARRRSDSPAPILALTAAVTALLVMGWAVVMQQATSPLPSSNTKIQQQVPFGPATITPSTTPPAASAPAAATVPRVVKPAAIQALPPAQPKAAPVTASNRRPARRTYSSQIADYDEVIVRNYSASRPAAKVAAANHNGTKYISDMQ
jgi:hypothetical protein